MRHRHCSDASRAAHTGRNPSSGVVSGAGGLGIAADDITRSSRGRSHSCRHVRWGPAVLPHTRDRVAPARRVGGEPRFTTAVCPRTLALGTCRDHRSRVSPARSLFSSQLTAASFVLTPSESGGFPPCGAVPVLQVLHRGPSSTATQSLRLAPGRLDVSSESRQVRGVGYPAHGQLWDF